MGLERYQRVGLQHTYWIVRERRRPQRREYVGKLHNARLQSFGVAGRLVNQLELFTLLKAWKTCRRRGQPSLGRTTNLQSQPLEVVHKYGHTLQKWCINMYKYSHTF